MSKLASFGGRVAALASQVDERYGAGSADAAVEAIPQGRKGGLAHHEIIVALELALTRPGGTAAQEQGPEASGQLAAAQSQIRSLESRMGTMVMESDTLREDAAQLRTDLKGARAQIGTLQTDLATARADAARLQTELAAATARETKATGELQTMRADQESAIAARRYLETEARMGGALPPAPTKAPGAGDFTSTRHNPNDTPQNQLAALTKIARATV